MDGRGRSRRRDVPIITILIILIQPGSVAAEKRKSLPVKCCRPVCTNEGFTVRNTLTPAWAAHSKPPEQIPAFDGTERGIGGTREE
jgi:hypothetical protein